MNADVEYKNLIILEEMEKGREGAARTYQARYKDTTLVFVREITVPETEDAQRRTVDKVESLKCAPLPHPCSALSSPRFSFTTRTGLGRQVARASQYSTASRHLRAYHQRLPRFGVGGRLQLEVRIDDSPPVLLPVMIILSLSHVTLRSLVTQGEVFSWRLRINIATDIAKAIRLSTKRMPS